ncbi:ComF family protein [Nocardia goodfellowii]|uniref:Amidophosphoribosyltransferase n=1 Tax=Nocardia goodfellowii TaxID=882446 RepID=A0ABS4QE93_9NOCA|nr:ComF family protein [Nocardia goodfellowii]MBP2189429.1 putative amidophosphoribosyltransferase [Nocardia goodfellowii]
MGTLLDLILPSACAGCDRPGTGWCADCDGALGSPVRVRPRIDPGVPCWALSPYAGAARCAVLAAKERGRRDLSEPLGHALARRLAEFRDGRVPMVLVPAPSRSAAARQRGGDPVLRMTRAAARWLPDCQVAPVLRVWRGVRDSVGLTPNERERNLRGRITVPGGSAAVAAIPEKAEVVLVDDVLTTGATARESVRALAAAGVVTRAVLVTCTA